MSGQSTSSSSEEEVLTCLLDLVRGGTVRDTSNQVEVGRDTTGQVVVKEEIHQSRNSIQRNQMQAANNDKAKKEGSREVGMWEQVDILKREICALLVDRDRQRMKLRDVKKKDESSEELKRKLSSSKEMVERAKNSREQLRELYSERSKEKMGTGRVAVADQEEFYRLREEYFR